MTRILRLIQTLITLATVFGGIVSGQVYQYTGKVCQSGFCKTSEALSACVGKDTQGRWIFVTIGHGVKGLGVGSLKIQIRGNWYSATPINLGPDQWSCWYSPNGIDLAFLTIQQTPMPEPESYKLALADPQFGSMGYTVGKSTRLAPAQVQIIASSYGEKWLAINKQMEWGDSGGPILNDRMELISTISGAPIDQRQNTHGVKVSTIREYLRISGITLASDSLPQGVPNETHPPPEPPEGNHSSPPQPAPGQQGVPTTTPEAQVSLNAEQIAKLIIEQMASDPRFAPKPGPQGPPGKDGRDGKDGETKMINQAQPITVQIVDENGKVIDEKTYQPGQPIRLKLTPLNKGN